MSEATTEGRFCIDLPDSDAATALSGAGQSTLQRLGTLTGAAFAFMWRSMDLMFKQLDRPIQQIHPEMRDIKPDDELLVFKVVEKEED